MPISSQEQLQWVADDVANPVAATPVATNVVVSHAASKSLPIGVAGGASSAHFLVTYTASVGGTDHAMALLVAPDGSIGAGPFDLGGGRDPQAAFAPSTSAYGVAWVDASNVPVFSQLTCP